MNYRCFQKIDGLYLCVMFQMVLNFNKLLPCLVFIQAMGDPRFATISQIIQEVVHDDTHYQKGTLNMRTQKCFAIKPRINGKEESFRQEL